ncbi:hypothetical protein TL16_g09905 [Triparma laevis f. inornata]|uniref:Uncharacterized protein n=1 Tax=Triparma laevis f. inornata TaxID=1714386 RepID=A0A9W7B974_9STRA|nr:hypothetical protein TL16_g09905 [Triparma laevis f. inornata]
MRPCGHSAACRDCTRELMTRSEPCPLCRKPISGFDVGVYSNSVGERGLWLTSARNIRELAKNDGFNEDFQKQFNGNEATFLRWKEVFDVLEIVGGRGCHCTVRENMEQQVLTITRSEDLVKLRALAKLCSQEFFDDQSLLAVAWRRILEVLELAMLEEKKTRGKKKQKKNKKNKKKDPRKLEILDACAALGRAVSFVGDMDDAIRYNKRAKDGYEEQLGRDSEKALDVTRGLIANTTMSRDKKIEKYRDLLKRCERALGEENVTTLSTLYSLGAELQKNGENEEAKGVFERAYEGYEKTLGKSHPETLTTVMNRGGIFSHVGDFGTAEELFQTAFEGYEAQLGKDHDQTKASAENLATVQMLIKNETNSDSSQIRSRIS